MGGTGRSANLRRRKQRTCPNF